jgi:Mg-chelatase subunit ChlD
MSQPENQTEETTMSDQVIELGKIESPRQWVQLVTPVVDGSGSMTEMAAGNITKAQAANNAIRELLTRLKASRVARNFKVAMITFDDKARVRLQPTDVGPSLDDNDNYDPLIGHGSGTQIAVALEEAGKVADAFLASAPSGGVPHSVIILLMSDGDCQDAAKAREAADRIKKGPNGSRITICSTLFATVGKSDPASEAVLKDVANDPVMGYKTVYDGETLRGFFEKSISAASGGVRL